MQAIILSIGDELTLGQTVDTNSAYLSDKLALLGISTCYHQTLPDDLPAITSAIKHACQQVKLVLITGGIGPTLDDLTRQALADAMDEPLVFDQASWQAIQQRFKQAGRTIDPVNKVQAYCPKTASMIPNGQGTAPGLRATLTGASIYVTPGVPSELYTMFDQSIWPKLEAMKEATNTIVTTKINTFGMGESTLGKRLGSLCDRNRNPLVGTTVSGGSVSVRIRSLFPTAQQAQEKLEETACLVENELGSVVYGRDEDTLAKGVVDLLSQSRQTLVTAESCTGGLLGKLMTDVPGASKAYLGGWVTYSNDMKIKQLNVPTQLIEKHGAVSPQVALAMVAGALEQSGATLAVSVTGIAGPGGGTADKPVGTAWVGLGRQMNDVQGGGQKGDMNNVQSLAVGLKLIGSRESIRDRAALCCLQMLRMWMLGLPLEALSFVSQVIQGKAGHG